MTSGEPQPPSDVPLSPEEVSRREFAPARKGYDRAEVRAFLESVASAIEAASERIAELERQLARDALVSGEVAPEVEEALLEAVSAEAWRDDVLADLDRRRRELNAEVVRLRAGRDRLRADLGEVVSEMAEHVRRLDGSLQAARAAGDLEEQRIQSGPGLSAEERRAELEAAWLAGFVTVGSPPDEAVEQQPPAGLGGPTEAGPASAHEPPDDQAADIEIAAPDGVGAGQVDVLFARLRAECSEDPLDGQEVEAGLHADDWPPSRDTGGDTEIRAR